MIVIKLILVITNLLLLTLVNAQKETPLKLEKTLKLEQSSKNNEFEEVNQKANLKNEAQIYDLGLEDGNEDDDMVDKFNYTHYLSSTINIHDERNLNKHRYSVWYREPPSPADETTLNVGVDDGIIEELTKRDTMGANGDQPFYICNLDDVVNKFKLWLKYLPRIHPFYAIKCNPDPNVAKVLASLGAGFDCASMSEIDQVLTMEVKPSKIIFAHPIKSVTSLLYAKSRGVKYMTFDSNYELDKVAEHYPKAKLLIRIKVDDKGSKFRLGNKFGVLEKDQFDTLKYAKQLNLNISGIAFHVGGVQETAEAWVGAIERARHVYELAKQVGYQRLHILNIGGGYPGKINYDDPNDLFYEYAKDINEAIDKNFPKEEFPHLKIIAEPGRYFVTTAFAMVNKIIGKRKSEKEGNEQIFYYVNDGIYQGFLNHIYEPEQVKNLYPLLLDGDVKARQQKKYNSTIWGQTCSDKDHILEDIMIPEMFPGEHFVIKEYGSYTYTFTTEFNGFQRSFVKYVIGYDNRQYLEG